MGSMVPEFRWMEQPREAVGYEADVKALLAGRGLKAGGLSLMRLERAILRLGLWKTLGTREEEHWVRFAAHLVPSLETDPWFQERVWSFFDTRRRGKQITNWWGSQNSGKTKTMAVLANAHGVLWHDFTRQIVSGPIKESGDSEIWGQMNDVFEEIRREWSAELKACGLVMKQTASKFDLRFSEAQRAGSIRFVAIDDVGKVQGGKAKDIRQTQGYVLFWLDETGVWNGRTQFLEALPNLKSNDNLHVVTACNPKNPEGELDGELSRPRGGFSVLNMDTSHVWESEKYGAVTYRFDGLRSPNFEHGERWPWLFNARRERTLREDYGENSPKYNEQCRAFMGTGLGLKYVLTSQDLVAGAVEMPFVWAAASKWRAAYLDPGFTNDGDAAVFTVLEGGEMHEEGGHVRPVVELAEQFTIPVWDRRRGELVADDSWVERCRAVRGRDDAILRPGSVVSVERELAVKAAEACLQRGISWRDFGYDDSMRGRMMEAVQWAMGDAPLIVSYVGDAEDVPMFPRRWVGEGRERRLRTWKEECQKFVSQIWFAGAAVVRSGMFRQRPGLDRWAAQARRRLWAESLGGKKRDVEGKAAYKQRPPKESPDFADSLFGAFYVAQKRGRLQLAIDRAEPHGVDSSHQIISRQWKERGRTRGLYGTGSR